MIKTSENTWIPEKIWQDEPVFILGGGPSLNLANLDLIKHHHVIGVNNAFLLGDWVDAGWFGDSKWLEWHREKFMEFKGIRASCNRKYEFVEAEKHWIHFIARGKIAGIETIPGHVSWNRCSGSSAINFAYHLGGNPVILIGFDMRAIQGKNNWHDDHQTRLEYSPYKGFLECYDAISKDAKRLGLEIINTTKDSAIKQFPIIDLEKVVCELR